MVNCFLQKIPVIGNLDGKLEDVFFLNVCICHPMDTDDKAVKGNVFAENIQRAQWTWTYRKSSVDPVPVVLI